MSVSLTKIEQQAPALLSLAKTAAKSLDDYNLGGQKAKVALVLDFSGSMRNDYASGSMQRLAEKVLALGTQLDDDGAIDLFIFHSGAEYLGEITLGDYADSINRLTRGRHMGTTNYADAFYAVRDHYKLAGGTIQKRGLFGTKTVAAPTTKASEPVYALFLTDGVPNSKPAAVKAITEVSTAPIFWKFLSIGSENIEFLQKLDDLDDRFVDNADYKPVGNVDKLGNEQLFDILLDEYPTWLAEVRQKGLI